jgi:hypothetical protein
LDTLRKLSALHPDLSGAGVLGGAINNFKQGVLNENNYSLFAFTSIYFC